MPTEREKKQKLLGYARQMRKAPSDAEKKLWHSLRRNQLDGLRFRRQKPISAFIADFACDECRVIVEVDGEQHDDAIEYDEKRTAFLQSLGWHVVRFSASYVVKELDGVLQTILNACRDVGDGRPPP